MPANPLLAEPMYLAGYIERMGTETRDMIRRCTEAGLPEPAFAVSDGFQTTIRRVQNRGAGETREETRDKTREETRENTREKMLALIAADPAISTKELAEQIGITPKGIEWQIRQLKQAGRLKRVDPRKGGRWEIIRRLR